jgi:hypothetical protein
MSATSNISPYHLLGNAVVLQAVRDYRKANKKCKHSTKNIDALSTKKQCLNFFRSEWFTVLTDIDGEMLIRRLDQEVSA